MGCCNCGNSLSLDVKFEVCTDCGGFACDIDCIDEHECDVEGDMVRATQDND